MLKQSLFMCCLAGLPAAHAADIELSAPGPQGALAGSLLEADRVGAPVALIIPGSGPTDRDGNNPMGISAGYLKLLAQALASHGITTLRIDKRGMYGSHAAVADANAVTVSDYVDDLKSWGSVLRERQQISCIWIIGHSEGGLIALAAAQDMQDVCGLVLLSTPGRPLDQIVEEQLRNMPTMAPYAEEAVQVMRDLRNGKLPDVQELSAPLMSIMPPQVHGFLASLLRLDQRQLIASITRPVLVVQGLRDLQVQRADAETLVDANPNAELAIFPNANHVLKDVASDNAQQNLLTYSAPDLPLAEGLADRISDFIKRPR